MIIQCSTCGNCEKNFHTDLSDNKRLGFCLLFKENVKLNEKNIKCWTTTPHTYYQDLFLQKEKIKKAKNNITKKLIQIDQLQLFDFNVNNEPFKQ